MVQAPPDATETPLAGGSPPVTETRGGERPDWARVRPGEPLPERDGDDSVPQAGDR